MNQIANRIFGMPSLGMAVLATLFLMPGTFGAELIKAEVPFAFKVGAKTLPAGEYEIQLDRQGESVTVLGVAKVKGSSAVEPIITSLAPTAHSDSTHSHIVFDKVGSVYTLSEIWRPGADGILVHATKGPHEHHVLHLKP